ncbi:PAS domain S-box protein [Nocardioides cavernae]|uniref:protein-glutamate O-methyltransferase n=1 Tax=Nocardioides cavernae TaxID=1921566 RepID=A0ABR8N9Z3_9ACTN|nr:CheR family methyltransferase [Nocardioides cavernae]MBD3924957.1 PAS domain S-box protein [Nocardioides cavernae]MBM7514669.1 two-component system CheB/CheR fusion protein [Nocardioides cavernae]
MTDADFEALLRHIKEQRAFDFTGYKRASLARRVERRMEAVGVTDHDEYLDRLMVNPDEFTQLFNTILINVTAFFRDTDAWDYLRTELLPELLQRREGQPIRVWCAGCASGQEAYSLAMALAELLGVDEFRERVKIYATDVDEEALAQARQATYSEGELEGVPVELREKYFEPAGHRFVFRKELRRAVIFGRNDLVQDAPISHVDLLSCRNTLMYFNAETQSHILNRMHFALRPDGVLFLGKAEMLLGHSAYFRPVELKRRFFTKVPTEARDRRVQVVSATKAPVSDDQLEASRLRQAALMSSAAAQIVLDTDDQLILCNNRAMHQFGLTARDIGRPFQDLEVSYRPVELRAHIEEARQQRRGIWVRDVEQVRSGETLSLDIQVVPLSDETGVELGITVIFNDVTQYRQLQNELTYTNRQLEIAYEELQSTNEELETTNEELQSTVEELETTNEELQSTNEELETMNEELQSMNDELQFSNESLRDRQDEVERLNRFMAAVLGSMNSGVAVVDADMQILAWNSRAEDLWGVRTDEALGEHLMNLDIGLPLEQLRQPIKTQFADAAVEPSVIVLDAVNRRGKSLQVHVTLTHIVDHGASAPAAMLVMDVVDGPG